MKKFAIILLAVLTQNCYALKVENQKYSTEELVLYSLNTNNNGVIESTIFNLLNLTLKEKEIITDRIYKQLKELNKDSDSERIKDCTALAIRFYEEDCSKLRKEIKIKYNDHKRLYTALTEALNKSDIK